jgi:hypothetical protein
MADDRGADEAADRDGPNAGLGSLLLAGLRRLLVLIVIASAVTALVSLAIGLPAGASVTRSLSVGFYLVGAFWLIAGFFVGNRGPVRLKSDLGAPLFGSRFVRWATPEEREETINMSAIYVLLGFALIFLGFATDTRYRLF